MCFSNNKITRKGFIQTVQKNVCHIFYDGYNIFIILVMILQKCLRIMVAFLQDINIFNPIYYLIPF